MNVTSPGCDHRFITHVIRFCDDGPITYVVCTQCRARLSPSRPIEARPPGVFTHGAEELKRIAEGLVVKRRG